MDAPLVKTIPTGYYIVTEDDGLWDAGLHASSVGDTTLRWILRLGMAEHS